MNPPQILVLAAGKGTRMKSKRPKVLHEVLFRPMLHHVLDTARAIDARGVTVVIGHGAEEVRTACAGFSGVEFALQEKQLGTGHAVMAAREPIAKLGGTLLILSGDTILTRPESLRAMLAAHRRAGALCTVGTAVVPRPQGYGRILRSADGGVADIREETDCSEAERRIDEVNGGIYCFEAAALLEALETLSTDNKQGEYYLTDTVRALAKKGKTGRFLFEDPWEVAGINDHGALSEVESVLRRRVNEGLMRAGVSLQDPASTYIDARCRLEPDVRVEAGVTLIDSSLAAGSRVESGSRVIGSTVGPGTVIKQGSYLEKAEIGAGASVGPYAHLRPGTKAGDKVRIGNFVETKNASFAEGAKASHLSYIGDAEVGREVNIGCGFITCNYDGGPVKQRTVIEEEAFIGSDSQTVAPVRIGARAYVATGTTVTEDVPADALAISRGRQVTKDGYGKKLRARSGVKKAPGQTA